MRLFYRLLLVCCIGLLPFTGCGEEEHAKMSTADDTAEYAYGMEREAQVNGVEITAGTDLQPVYVIEEGRAEVELIDASQSEQAPPSAAEGRKIIYNARIDLVVDDFDKVPADVTALAKKFGGFIASSSIRGSKGEPRSGRWTLRIPSVKFDDFVSGAQSIGQVREMTSDSREVTAEYVDLESRVRNLKAEEERLHKHLDENTRSLKEILEVERELARVRGQIEMHQGRLNVLKDLTSLSTVTLTVEEIKDYVPEATEEPGFATQVARTWHGSIDAVGSFLTALSLAAVGFTPWLVVVVPLVLVAWFALKRLKRVLHKPAAKQASV